MRIAGMLLVCSLMCSTPEGRPMRPPEIVADAMSLPAGSAIGGQPLTLLAAVSSTGERGQQLKIVHTYWQLAQAVANYRFCLDHTKTLKQVGSVDKSDASLRLADSSAVAQLREAELRAVRTQHELAELVRMPAGSALPLPADRPYVGVYRTSFKELFAGRTPPESARLAERILPIQRQAIDDRAAAVQAADNALDDYQRSRGSAAAIVACSRERLRQQQAFMDAVYQYNRCIADYALIVAAPGTAPQALVGMLIGPPQTPTGAPSGSSDSSVRATSATEPITTKPTQQPRRNEPTLAPPRLDNEPTPAPPYSPDRPQPSDKNVPPLLPPAGDKNGKPAAVLEKPLVPIGSLPSPSRGELRLANKPAFRPATVLDDNSGPVAAATPFYPALVAAVPAVRAKQLTLTLFWDRTPPEGSGKPLNLADCLRRDAGNNRRATVDAYWLVRQRAAEYQLLVGQAELFESLQPVVLEHRNDPLDAVWLQSAQLATRAAMRDAHVALIEAQYTLALRIGAIADADWPLASTVPHSGSYLLKLDAQPRSLAESWPVRRLAAMMPGLGDNVQQRAAAVIDADVNRTAAAKNYATGTGTIDQVIAAITEQTEQSSAFLDATTAYNRAIAEYATTVLPLGTPSDKLVAALVTKP